MKKHIYLAMLIILVSGIVLGYLAGGHVVQRRFHRMIKEGPQRLEELMVERLGQTLRLESSQMTAIREPVRRLAEDFEAGFRAHRHEMDMRAVQLFSEIRPFLDPDQQEILDQMTAEDLRPRPPRPPGGKHPPPRPHDGRR